jgi:hypothetical protein
MKGKLFCQCRSCFVTYAFAEVPTESFVRGFEARRAIIKGAGDSALCRCRFCVGFDLGIGGTDQNRKMTVNFGFGTGI